MGNANGEVVVQALPLRGCDAPLDAARIATKLGAPAVENRVLVAEHLGGTEAVPDLGVLSGNAQRHLFATTTNQDGNGAHWCWNIELPALLHDRERLAQGA